jgi:hypothetical protein
VSGPRGWGGGRTRGEIDSDSEVALSMSLRHDPRGEKVIVIEKLRGRKGGACDDAV